MADFRILLAYSIGLLVASPQIILTVRYYPKSIRFRATSSDKQKIGSIPLLRLLKSFFFPRLRDHVDGVFYPEVTLYIGIVGLVCSVFSHSWNQWLFLIVCLTLAMGRYTPIFRWVSPIMMRVPARWCYFASLSLAFMAVSGLNHVRDIKLLYLLSVLQAADLCFNTSSLWPMEPYTQRCERPSKAFYKPCLILFKEPWRVSGLTFPQRTGHVTHTRTLGYTGGAQLTSMANFRHDLSPDGSGLHDWFQEYNTQEEANWFGVRWAITMRPLKPPWKPTQFIHVYENIEVRKHVPDWTELEAKYGTGNT